MAVEWLRGLLREEFPGPAAFPRPPEGPAPASAEHDEAGAHMDAARVWRREWLRRWRRLQLPEQLRAFRDALDDAHVPEEVHAVFAAHAASVVDAHRCLVFFRGASGRLEEHPLCGGTGAGLWIADGAVGEGREVGPSDPAREAGLAGLAPLFQRAGAQTLLAAPYAGGAAVLVERRGERELAPIDHELLALLAATAEASLRRVALVERLGVGAGHAPADGAWVEQVLCLGRAGVALGLEVTLLRMRVRDGGGAGGEDGMRRSLNRIRTEARGAGPALRSGAREILVVLNGGRAAADALLRRVRPALDGEVELEVETEPLGPPGPADELRKR